MRESSKSPEAWAGMSTVVKKSAEAANANTIRDKGRMEGRIRGILSE